MADNQDDSFNASKAEVFEALGHPTRIKILQTLSEKPLPFSELKRAAGLESNGLLTFHLGRLRGLVKSNAEGAYALTEEGGEALRIIEASRKQQHEDRLARRPAMHMPRQRAVLALLLVALISVGLVAVYQQEQITALNASISSNTIIVGGIRYRFLTIPLTTMLDAKSIVFEGVNFTTASTPLDAGNGQQSLPGTVISFINMTAYPAFNFTGSGTHSSTFLPTIVVNSGTSAVEYWNPSVVTIGGKTPLNSAPEHVNVTFTNPPGALWFTEQDHPNAGIGWDESSGILTFYVKAS
jgi:DNA-binding transcriptional ArsR family regulator